MELAARLAAKAAAAEDAAAAEAHTAALKAKIEAELKAQEEETKKAEAAKAALRGKANPSCASGGHGLTTAECWTANMPEHIADGGFA